MCSEGKPSTKHRYLTLQAYVVSHEHSRPLEEKSKAVMAAQLDRAQYSWRITHRGNHL